MPPVPCNLDEVFDEILEKEFEEKISLMQDEIIDQVAKREAEYRDPRLTEQQRMMVGYSIAQELEERENMLNERLMEIYEKTLEEVAIRMYTFHGPTYMNRLMKDLDIPEEEDEEDLKKKNKKRTKYDPSGSSSSENKRTKYSDASSSSSNNKGKDKDLTYDDLFDMFIKYKD